MLKNCLLEATTKIRDSKRNASYRRGKKGENGLLKLELGEIGEKTRNCRPQRRTKEFGEKEEGWLTNKFRGTGSSPTYLEERKKRDKLGQEAGFKKEKKRLETICKKQRYNDLVRIVNYSFILPSLSHVFLVSSLKYYYYTRSLCAIRETFSRFLPVCRWISSDAFFPAFWKLLNLSGKEPNLNSPSSRANANVYVSRDARARHERGKLSFDPQGQKITGKKEKKKKRWGKWQENDSRRCRQRWIEWRLEKPTITIAVARKWCYSIEICATCNESAWFTQPVNIADISRYIRSCHERTSERRDSWTRT